MRIIECAQRSPEWYAARLGVPTGSEFGRIITPKKLEYAAGADTYMTELIDEIVRPEAERGFTGNRHTARGVELEPDARDIYCLQFDVVAREVGFILNDAGTLGISPDSLIDPDGGLEIKCPDGPTHLRWLRAGGVPEDHKAQVHGALIVTGRSWWDFMSYCPPYRELIVRVTPDDYTAKLAACLERFVRELTEAKAAMGAWT